MYSTFTKGSELEPHSRMKFHIILNTLFLRVLPFAKKKKKIIQNYYIYSWVDKAQTLNVFNSVNESESK